MNSLKLLSLILNSISCVLLIVVYILARTTVEKSSANKYFISVCISIFLFCLADIGAAISKGPGPLWHQPVLYVSEFLYYLFIPVIVIFFFKYEKEYFGQENLATGYHDAAILIAVVHTILILASAFPGLFYEITSDNYYKRTKVSLLGNSISLFYFVLIIAYTISARKKVEKKLVLTSLSFPVISLISFIPQFFIPEIASVNVGIAVSTLFIYLNLYKNPPVKVKASARVIYNILNRKSKFNKYQRYISSFGFTAKEINDIRYELNEANKNILRLISGLCFLITIIALIFSAVFPIFSIYRKIFIPVLGICILAFSTSFIKSIVYPVFDFISLIFNLTFLLFTGTLNLYLDSTQPAIIFPIMLLIVPLLFTYRPYITWLLLLSTSAVYMSLCRLNKPETIVYIDGIVIIAILLLGIFLNYYLSKQKITTVGLQKNLKSKVDIYKEKIDDQVYNFVNSLIGALELKDKYTKGHSTRVAYYSVDLAKALNWPEDKVKWLYLSALLHDIGKIGIPDAILNKAGSLTNEEFEIIKGHPTKGYQLLRKSNQHDFSCLAARHHHERYDGKGYPSKLKGNRIPPSARIIAIADSYDAMASDRSYRNALPKEEIRKRLLDAKGTQFDPHFLDVFIELFDNDKLTKSE